MPINLGSFLPQVRFLTKKQFLSLAAALLLFTGIEAHSAVQFSATTPNQAGTFKLQWSGARDFVELREARPGTGLPTQILSYDSPPSGSFTLTRQPGRYIYLLFDCYFRGGPPNGNPECSNAPLIIDLTISPSPAPTVTASLSPAVISESGSATLTWNSSYAAGCSASGISGVSGTSGSVTYRAPTAMSSSRTVNIPVTCTGGGGSKTATASVKVNWVNDAPTISAIASRTINEDSGTGGPFTIGDEETSASSLSVTATSSNTNVVPNGNIVLGGNGDNRTISISSKANAHGSARITVKVTDAHGKSAQRSFTVTVTPVNDAPTVSAIPNVTIDEDQNTGVRSFTVSDVETAAGSLSVTAASSNTALVPNSNIVLAGSGSTRTIKVTPLPKRSGSATITVRVSDGQKTSSRSFTLKVNDVPARFTLAPATSSNGGYTIAWTGAKEYAVLEERRLDSGSVVQIGTTEVAASGAKRFTKTQSGDTHFSYGAEHQRFKQANGTATTYYFNGGAYEEIVSNGEIIRKTTIKLKQVNDALPDYALCVFWRT